jgi:hypothetical protein
MTTFSLQQNRFKVGLCISSAGYCKPGFTLSLSTLTPFLAQTYVLPGLSEQNFSLRIAESSSVCDNRHLLVRDALADGCTHICFIDDDMVFPRDAVHKLARWRQPVVAVNYRKRVPNGAFVATKPYPNGPTPYQQVVTSERTASLEEVTGLGFGLCLIEARVFQQLPQPWFEFRWDASSEVHIGEDIVFCQACIDHGIPLYIDHELSREIVHLGTFPYQWSDPLPTPE